MLFYFPCTPYDKYTLNVTKSLVNYIRSLAALMTGPHHHSVGSLCTFLSARNHPL